MTISIVTVTYNSASTLVDTIESVLSQTYKDIEYIVVDGKSTDNTMDIVRSYEPRFLGRMRYVSESDKGIYDAMNKGIRMATGDVVGILNSDDFFTHPYVIEEVARQFQNPDVEAVHGDVHYVCDQQPDTCVRYYSSANFNKWQMRFGIMPPHPSFYCRRSLYERYGGYDSTFRLGADFEFVHRLLYHEQVTMQYVPQDFVTMRVGGVTSSGLKSYYHGMLEHHRALKQNQTFHCYPLLFLGLMYKGTQMMWGRLSRWKFTGLNRHRQSKK